MTKDDKDELDHKGGRDDKDVKDDKGINKRLCKQVVEFPREKFMDAVH